MRLSSRLEKAIRISAAAHRLQRRKGTKIPYIIHPFSVMLLAAEETDDEDILIACLFHDIIEDVPDEYAEEKMREDFGERVVSIVRGVTKDESIGQWKQRSDAYLYHLENEAPAESTIVACADKIHNLMSMLREYDEIGEQLWKKFDSDKQDQLWWYKSVADIARRKMPDSSLCIKLDDLVMKLEKIVNQPS